MHKLRRLAPLAVLFAVLVAPATGSAQNEDFMSPNLTANGDFETDADGDGYPDDWPRVANARLETEDGNSYLAVEPYGGPTREIPLDPEWIAVEVSCRMRCRGLKMGPEGWHDARMVMSWNDADHQHVDPWPNVLRGDGTFDWREMSRTFIRPPGAEFLNIGPVNYGAEGIVDYDDIVIRGMETPPLRDVARPEGADRVWDLDTAWQESSVTRGKVCLNGLWQFRPVVTAEEAEAPPDGPGWGWFKVPGSWRGDNSLDVHAARAWEQTDFSALTAAWYGREFTVPADWPGGRRLELEFELVQSRANVFVDGRHAGDVLWPGGKVDVTELCRPGATHRVDVLALALPMDRQTQVFMGPDRAFDAPTDLNFRGLCGDVYLSSAPDGPRMDDFVIWPWVRDGSLAVRTSLSDLGDNAYTLAGEVRHDGRVVKRFDGEVVAAEDAREMTIVVSDWEDAPLWDTDDPQLCTLRLSLIDETGTVVDETLPTTFGYREFAIDGRDFFLNGKRIHLRAINLNNANTADAGSIEGAKNTFRRMRKYGFNAFIMSNYHFQVGSVNYFQDLLRAADEEGMLLAFSMPHFRDFGDLEDEEMQASYAELADWIARQVRDHPSVVLYAMNHNATGYQGDQNPELLDEADSGPDSSNRRHALIAQRIVNNIDPTRPAYHHQSGNLGDFYTLNCYLNWAPIRERSRWLNEWGENGTKPFFFVEWGLPHEASWSSHRGPSFIWRSNELQQAWTHEFAATFKGNDAYVVDESDRQCLRTELNFWEQEQPFHYYNLLQHFRLRERNVIELKSMYASQNWPAHRTWGVSAMLPWDYGSFWKQKPGASSAPIELERDWNSVQRPGVSPDRAVHGGSFYTSRYPEDDWEVLSIGQTFLRYNRPLLAYLGGRPGDFTECGHNFVPGETVEKQVVVVNDTRHPVRCSYEWRIGDLISGGGDVQSVEPGAIHTEPFGAALPADTAPGTYRLEVSVAFGNGEVQEDALDIHVGARAPTPTVAGRAAVYDPNGETVAALEGLGVDVDVVGVGDDLGGYDLLIIGRRALSVKGEAPDLSRVPEGLSVLVMEQTEDFLHRRLGFRTQTYGLRRAFPRVPDHPILQGVSAEQLADWRGDATLVPPYMEDAAGYSSYPMVQWCGFVNSRVWRCGNGGNVATVLIEKPMRGDFLPVVDGGFDLQYAPILECGIGAGRIVFCQMDVTARTERDPVAECLLANLVSYCASVPRRVGRTVHYSGDARGRALLQSLGATPSEAGRRPLGSNDLLIIGPAGLQPVAQRLEGALDSGANVLLLAQEAAALERLPMPCEYETDTIMGSMLRLPLIDPALAGLSNAEIHFRNFRELPLLAQPEPADERGLLAAQQLGRGKLVLCQVAPWMFDPAEFNHDRMTYRRTGFLVSRLLANLGARMSNPLLENWRRPAVVLPDLTTGWHGKADPDDVGEQEDWFRPGFDDSGWSPIEVPATYESQRPDLEDYDGVFWYRRSFDLGVVPEDMDLLLLIGAIDDEDWTYLNGELIGKVTAETHPDNHWNVERRYPIPPGLLKPEGNVLAVRVRDSYLSGGIVRGPVAIQAPGRWNNGYYIDNPEPGDDPYRYYRW